MTTLWRYMDFWKFESILSKKSLYFGMAASQSDKLEGIPTTGEKLMRSRHLAGLPEIQQSSLLANDEGQDEWNKRAMLLSCWHINDNTNSRAWKEYILDKNGEGLAIKTNLDILQKNFKGYCSKQVFCGCVQYIDRSTHRPRTLKREGKFFEKQGYLSWENEYRYIIDVTSCPFHDKENILKQAGERHKPSGGYFIHVDIVSLITDIYISPKSSSKFRSKVEGLCKVHKLSPTIR